MKLVRPSPHLVQLTLHVYELAALVSAARWAAEGGGGELAPEARESLARLLRDVDAAIGSAQRTPPSTP